MAVWGSPGRRLGLGLGAGDTARSLRGQLHPVRVWTLPCPGQRGWPPHSPGSPSTALGAGEGPPPQGLSVQVAQESFLHRRIELPAATPRVPGSARRRLWLWCLSPPSRVLWLRHLHPAKPCWLSGLGPLAPRFGMCPQTVLECLFLLADQPGDWVGKRGWRATPGGAGRSQDLPSLPSARSPTACLARQCRVQTRGSTAKRARQRSSGGGASCQGHGVGASCLAGEDLCQGLTGQSPPWQKGPGQPAGAWPPLPG